MRPNQPVDLELKKKLELLQQAPARDSMKQEQGLTAFLAEAKTLPKAVTPARVPRHNEWMRAIQSIFTTPKKERSSMLNTLTTIFLIVSAILGSGGVTLAAAQSSEVGQPLYEVKVMSEDFRLNLAANPQEKIDLSLQFAERRIAELQAMLQTGATPGDALLSRYQNQVQEAIRQALELSDGQATQELEQILARLKTQLQTMDQLRTGSSEASAAVMTQVQQRLQDQLRELERGLNNPEELRSRYRIRETLNGTVTPPASTPQGTAAAGTRPAGTNGTPEPNGTPQNCAGSGNVNCGVYPPPSHATLVPPEGTPGPSVEATIPPKPTWSCPSENCSSQPATPQWTNQPTSSGPPPTQPVQNQTQATPSGQQGYQTPAGPMPTTQSIQSTPQGQGPQPTSGPGGPRGSH